MSRLALVDCSLEVLPEMTKAAPVGGFERAGGVGRLHYSIMTVARNARIGSHSIGRGASRQPDPLWIVCEDPVDDQG